MRKNGRSGQMRPSFFGTLGAFETSNLVYKVSKAPFGKHSLL